MNRDFPEKLDRKVIYESDWISLYADRVRMPGGEIIESYHRLHYPHESVCVVICNDRDEILLIRSKHQSFLGTQHLPILLNERIQITIRDLQVKLSNIAGK